MKIGKSTEGNNAFKNWGNNTIKMFGSCQTKCPAGF